MIRQLALIAAFSLSAAAQSADLQITSFNVSKSMMETGERFTATMRWRNNGLAAAENVVATLGEASGAFVVTGAGTSNWPCEPAFGGEGFICRGVMAPGGEAEMVVTMLAPSAPRGAWNLRGTIQSTTPDTQTANNSAQQTIGVTPAENGANLILSPAEQQHHAAANSRVSIPLSVTNAGPSAAQNLILSLSFTPGSRIPIEAAGDGWSCRNATHSPWLVSCTRTSLGSGASSQLMVTVPNAPQDNGTYALYARVAAERSHDATLAQSIATLQIGTAAEAMKRILVPLTGGVVPGANGAQWVTETTGLITEAIGGWNVTPNKPFDLRAAGIVGNSPNGQLLLVSAANERKLRLNSRVYDASRTTETAGSEIPIAREEDFANHSQSIVGVPVASHYRHTLRVYDLDAQNGAAVRIAIYANDETTPRATVVRSLVVPDPTGGIFPAFLQLDPAELMPLAGLRTLRVTVEPVSDTTRIWSFISVTNNETHHVTTFSAQ